VDLLPARVRRLHDDPRRGFRLNYPYGFIDLGAMGWGGFLFNILIYGLGFYALGCLVIFVDRRTRRRALLGGATD
jgi:hypothetical protein